MLFRTYDLHSDPMIRPLKSTTSSPEGFSCLLNHMTQQASVTCHYIECHVYPEIKQVVSSFKVIT